MLAKSIKKKATKYQFKLDQLIPNNLREIILHLRKADQVNLAVVCKKWYQTFIPLIWEYFDRRDLSVEKYGLLYLLEKYGKYVKYFCDIRFDEFTIYNDLFPNLVEYRIDICNLILKDIFDPLPSGLTFYFDFWDHFSHESLLSNLKNHNLDFKKLLENTKYLEVYTNDTLLLTLLSSAPSNLISLSLWHNYSSVQIPNDSISIFTHLKHLKICKCYKMESGMNILQCVFFNLKSLEIGFCPKINIVQLASLNFSKLELLAIDDMKALKLEGTFKIRKLYATWSNLATFSISHNVLPDLRILYLYFRSHKSQTLSSKSLYDIFHLLKLTSLKLHFEGAYNQRTLLDEIYPKEINQLVSLRLERVVIGKLFFKYLLRSCKSLEILSLINCKFEEEEIENFIQIQPKYYQLNLTQLEINPCPKNGFNMIKYICNLSPCLDSLKLDVLFNPNSLYYMALLLNKSELFTFRLF